MASYWSVPRRALNRARLTINERLWRKTSLPPAETLTRVVAKPYSRTRATVPDQRVAAAFDESNERVKHQEWVCAVDGDLAIEPTSGFVMTRDRRLVREFIIYDHASVYPRWLSRPASEVQFDEVIQFDHHWGITYFHFYADVLHKLHLIDRFRDRLGHLPLVVSRRTFESKWFSFFRQFPWVADRKWFIQEPSTLVRAKRVWSLQPMPFESSYWLATRDLVEAYRRPMDPGRRIFINRPSTTGRYVKNVDAIRAVLERSGFETIELERATMVEQVALFSSASVIVTMHGAALTNLIYSSQHTRVLEFVPDVETSCHYYWVAQTMGLAHYDAVLGSPLEYDIVHYPRGRFSVAPEKLSSQLARLIDAPEQGWLRAR